VRYYTIIHAITLVYFFLPLLFHLSASEMRAIVADAMIYALLLYSERNMREHLMRCLCAWCHDARY